MADRDSMLSDGWSASVSFVFGVPGTCTYCGDPAQCIDHVIPWSFIAMRERKGSGGSAPGVRTYCCTECNVILSNKVHGSFVERAAFVRSRLLRRNAKWLQRPAWDDDELAELRGRLRQVVKAGEFLTYCAKLRTSWINRPDFWRIVADVRARTSDRNAPGYRQHIEAFFAEVSKEFEQ